MMSKAEVLARGRDPHIWCLDPPDISSSHYREMSLIRAKVQLGEIRWNPTTEDYEICDTNI